MRHTRIAPSICLVLCHILGISQNARAAIVAGVLTGVVDGIGAQNADGTDGSSQFSDFLGFDVGDDVRASFAYDTETLDTFLGFLDHYDGFYRLEIGGVVFGGSDYVTVNVTDNQVFLNRPGVFDTMTVGRELRSDNVGDPFYTRHLPIGWSHEWTDPANSPDRSVGAEFVFEDATASVFDGEAVPITELSDADFSSIFYRIATRTNAGDGPASVWRDGTGGSYSGRLQVIDISFDSFQLSLIPEPSAILLLGVCGVLGSTVRISSHT